MASSTKVELGGAECVGVDKKARPSAAVDTHVSGTLKELKQLKQRKAEYSGI